MKRGTQFFHARVLTPDNRPALCVVTAVRDGYVYWKLVGSARARDCFPLAERSKWVKQELLG